MYEFEPDEDIKIKKLKEEETFLPVNKKKKPIFSILVFVIGLMMFVCVSIIFGAIIIKDYSSKEPIALPTTDTSAIIVQKATNTPQPLPKNSFAFSLNINSLTTQLTPNASSTISFEIDYSSFAQIFVEI